jgi:hypothetical protein
MLVTLVRSERTRDGVFGRLHVPGIPPLHTCEEEDKGNQRSISCIPAGRYPLRRTTYYAHGYETFVVCNVPGRSRILVHPGNTEEDTMGCILPGLYRGTLLRTDENTNALVEKQAVTESKKAFALFMDGMSGVDEAEIEVRWATE